MNFKEQVERDIKTVFHSTQTFADVKKITLGGNFYNIPILMDTEDAKDRQKLVADHVDGIFAVDVMVYLAFSDLKVMPRHGQVIEINDDIYNIISVGNEMGEIVLGLRRLDE